MMDEPGDFWPPVVYEAERRSKKPSKSKEKKSKAQSVTGPCFLSVASRMSGISGVLFLERKIAIMSEKQTEAAHSVTIEERRAQLTTLLAREQQGSAIERRIDVEMRLMLEHYDGLEQRRVPLLEAQPKPDQDNQRSSESARAMRNIQAEERTIQARLEFAGELLDIDRLVITTCLSTIALHYLEHGESSFEHAYPLLQGYFLGEDILPFPQLGFFTKEEVIQLLDMEQEG
jgi:hypothetical protein